MQQCTTQHRPSLPKATKRWRESDDPPYLQLVQVRSGHTSLLDGTNMLRQARLRGQAGVCKFIIQCSGYDRDVNYTDAILRDVLTRGLSDPEIQLDLLGNRSQDMSLEQRSASLLFDSQGAEAASSSYRRNKNIARLASNKVKKPDSACSYCRKKGHGTRAPLHVRKKECPAFGQTCHSCNKINHFEAMCRGQKANNAKSEVEGAVFDTLAVCCNEL